MSWIRRIDIAQVSSYWLTQADNGLGGMPRSVATQLCLSRGVTCENTLIFHGIRVPASKSQLKPVKQGHSMQLSARRAPTHVRNYLWPFRCYALYVRHGLSPTTNASFPSTFAQMCRLLLLCFRFSWLLNWKLIYFCTNSPLPGLARPWPRIRQSTYRCAHFISPSHCLSLFHTPSLPFTLLLLLVFVEATV